MIKELRILVVDDEESVRTGIARILEDVRLELSEIDGYACFSIEQSESAEHALEIIEKRPPDILLLDHRLPGISGIEAIERIKACAVNTLTIMITGYASLETAVRAIKQGAYDFLAKPFTPDELKSTIRKAAAHIVVEQRARQLAEEKRRVRFEFISVLAHELKAPIGAVEGYLDILRNRTAGDHLDAYEKMVDRSLVRLRGMRKLIEDLLDLTRIESGQKHREVGVIDVREVAQEVVLSFAESAKSRGIDISLDVDGCVSLSADRNEIEIILNNLVSNAIKYNRDRGRVEIRISCENGYTQFDVADTGIGMSEEETKRIFDDFVRIKTKQTRYILGSGLGLSIVRKLAALYEGTVTVSSEPHVGTKFTVRLRNTVRSEEL